MAQAIPPTPQLNFGGVITAGNQLLRPQDTSVLCNNLRPMPGGGLRLRSGCTRRLAPSAGNQFVQWHEFRKGSLSAGLYHLIQRSTPAGEWWDTFNIPGYTGGPLLGVAGPSMGGKHLAITSVRDKVWLFNGLGIRDNSNSRPPFTSWDGSRLRYVGLDAYVPPTSVTRPTASTGSIFTGIAPLNNIQVRFGINVGLYNIATGHFSNGVFAGNVGYLPDQSGPPMLVRIEIRFLTSLSIAYHDTLERDELKYVFYSTLDGGGVPYLILNAAGNDVFTVPITTDSVHLSLTNQDSKGFFVDENAEMPTENWPPRPMERIAYSNGRVYGILQAGGSEPVNYWGDQKFRYSVEEKDAAAIAYSANSSEFADRNFVGIPEESWPQSNKKYMPNGERARHVSEGPNRGQIIACSSTGSYYLEETADGLILPETISEYRGIGDPRSYAKTPYGHIWVTRDHEIVMLDPASMRLVVLSSDYAELLGPAYAPSIGIAAAYILDPPNQIDRYQVWGSGMITGYSVIHDFALEKDQKRRGVSVAQAYTAVHIGHVQSAAEFRDAAGRRYHIIANEAIWTHEGDPETERVPTRDQQTDGQFFDPSPGDWIGQWLSYGDYTVRKEFNRVALIGDFQHSGVLRQTYGYPSPVLYSWYGNLVDGNEHYVDLMRASQEDDDTVLYIGSPADAKKRWYKHKITIRGHAYDTPEHFNYPVNMSFTGEAQLDLYGTLMRLDPTINPAGGNR